MARDICVSLGKRIRQLRKERCWRQIDLAAQVGINENYVSDLELGKKEICIHTLEATASAFGIPLHELLKDI